MRFIHTFIYYLSLQIGIMLFTFVLFHIIPTDPARIILGPYADETQVESARKELGLDKPLLVQFADYLYGVSRFDFGKSYTDNRPVYQEVCAKFKLSLFLVFLSLLFVLLYCFVVIAGDRRINSLLKLLNFFFVSMPTFFSGTIIAVLVFLYYPFTAFSGELESMYDYLYMVPPAFVLALYPMAILARILSQQIESISESPYIKYVRVNGLSEWQIRFRHILKNAMIPFLAAFSNQLPMLFTGAFIVEIIFSIPAIGSLLVTSILQKDFPMLQGIVIVNGVFFILINFVFEILYPLIDPRINSANASK